MAAEGLAMDDTSGADGFADAFQRHAARLTTFAVLLVGQRDTADDLVAEAFARVWARHRRRSVDELAPYLHRTVANLAGDTRRRRRLEARELASRRLDWRTPGGMSSPVDDSNAERRRALHAALLQIPLEQRAVIVCRHLLDMSEDATAEALGLRVGTVKSRLARGMGALRTILERDGGVS